MPFKKNAHKLIATMNAKYENKAKFLQSIGAQENELTSHQLQFLHKIQCEFNNFTEIKQNAQRNRREFAAEGWKWENAVEEDDMYLDKSSNERIHPCHLGGCILDLR